MKREIYRSSLIFNHLSRKKRKWGFLWYTSRHKRKTPERQKEWGRKEDLYCLCRRQKYEKRIISKEQGKQYAEDNDIDYFETSALTGEGVKELVDFAVRSLVANTDYEEEENTKLKKLNKEKDNKCAC